MANKRSFLVAGGTIAAVILFAAICAGFLVGQMDTGRLSMTHASFLAGTGQNEAAIATFDQVLSRSPENSDALFAKGELLYELGRNDEGLEVFQKVTKLRPRDTMSWIYLSYFFLKAEKYDDIVKAADKAIALGPPHPYAWNNRGVGLKETGRAEEALVSFDKALELHPRYFHALNNKGWLLNQLGRAKDAVSLFDDALRVEPDNDEAWAGRGRALLDLERYEEAVNDLERASRLGPENGETWSKLSLAYEAVGKLNHSIDAAVEAQNRGVTRSASSSGIGSRLDLINARAQIFFDLGERLATSGDHRAALSNFRKALKLVPDDYYARQKSAECLVKLGRAEAE